MKFIKTHGGYVKRASVVQAFVAEYSNGFYVVLVVDGGREIEQAIGSFETGDEAEKYLDNFIKELEETK